MVNCIKCLSKVKFEEHNFFLGALALIYVFEHPCEAILDSATFEETVLFTVNYFKNDLL